MYCESCHTNEAILHIKNTTVRETTDIHLCLSCSVSIWFDVILNDLKETLNSSVLSLIKISEKYTEKNENKDLLKYNIIDDVNSLRQPNDIAVTSYYMKIDLIEAILSENFEKAAEIKKNLENMLKNTNYEKFSSFEPEINI